MPCRSCFYQLASRFAPSRAPPLQPVSPGRGISLATHSCSPLPWFASLCRKMLHLLRVRLKDVRRLHLSISRPAQYSAPVTPLEERGHSRPSPEIGNS